MEYSILVVVIFTMFNSGVFGKAVNKQLYCHREDPTPYLYMGSKTSYEVIRGVDAIPLKFKSCKPVKFWSLNRHGTRVAGASVIENFKELPELKKNIISNHEEKNIGLLCKKDLKALKAWRWDESLEDLPNTLTEQGWRELQKIAKRYSKRLPDIFHQAYNESKFYFRYTDEQRTEASCKAFVTGLFGKDSLDKIRLEEPIANDPILRPYKNCSTWREEEGNIEIDKFEETSIFTEMLKEVSKRLGFSNQLEKRTVSIMYDICRFEKAWRPREVSPWCVAFTKDNLHVLEYLDDMQHFYKSGYGGGDINPLLGCITLRDLLEKFTSYVEEGQPGPDVVSYFTHDTMLLLVQTALGVGLDSEPLRSDNYDTMAGRNWRTSHNAAFATNIVAVLYACEDDPEEFRVQLHLNERPLDFCKGQPQGWCSWNEFQNRLLYTLQCSTEVCDQDNTSVFTYDGVAPLARDNFLKRSIDYSET